MSCAAAGWAPPPTSAPPAGPVDHPLYFRAARAWQELGRTASQREHWSASEDHLCLFDPQDGTFVELTIDDDADSVAVRWVFVDATGARAPTQGSGNFQKAVQACRAYASDGSPDPQQPLTAERFFALADAALELGLRLELIDGRVVAMAGASPSHEAIVISTGMALKLALGPKGCKVYGSNLYVKSAGSHVLPDVTVVCGEPDWHQQPGQPRCLGNPSVVVEVLSASTAHKDTGEKVQTYLSIGSLKLYIIVHSDRRLVEVWWPGLDAPQQWRDGDIPLDFPGRTLSLDDIYDQVDL
jgi:Uma2 family endonuclease